ncbi:hypothetical protein SAMN05660199_00023 [Klenkia soli]|uniref:DUF222 domain-containing protein n=1 Tax=Klenkia soli TaxID=1052260 RepID=A0A1H0BHD0_9ACTN|nr:hypothetical protein [Klenkia soli]SDN45038.1 hypothetical protein SAMN05660199_00023 [Klenkia soli]
MGELGTDPSFDPFPDTGMLSAAAAAWAALDAEVAATRAAEEQAAPARAITDRATRTAERDATRQLSMTLPADVAAVLDAARGLVDAQVPLGGPAVVAPALLARVRGLAQLANVVDTALAHAVRAAECAQAAEFDGHKTMRAWLPGHLNIIPATAARVVRAGRTLEQLPRWDTAAREGRVTPDQTATVAKVATPARLAAALDLGVDLHGEDGRRWSSGPWTGSTPTAPNPTPPSSANST